MGCKCMPLAIGGKKKNRYFILDGDINIDTVAELKPKIIKAISKEALYQIDLSKIEQCDISGLQLLYSLLLTLINEKKEFFITEMSSAVLDLLEMTGTQFPESPEMTEV